MDFEVSPEIDSQCIKQIRHNRPSSTVKPGPYINVTPIVFREGESPQLLDAVLGTLSRRLDV